MDHELQQYLDAKFQSLEGQIDSRFKGFEGRVYLLEREVHQLDRNQLTGTKAVEIFRTTSLHVNTVTRVAVAVIAALGIGTTSVQNALANHDAASLELRCQKGTSDALIEADKRREVRDIEIARRAVQLRDEEVDYIIGRSHK